MVKFSFYMYREGLSGKRLGFVVWDFYCCPSSPESMGFLPSNSTQVTLSMLMLLKLACLFFPSFPALWFHSCFLPLSHWWWWYFYPMYMCVARFLSLACILISFWAPFWSLSPISLTEQDSQMRVQITNSRGGCTIFCPLGFPRGAQIWRDSGKLVWGHPLDMMLLKGFLGVLGGCHV